ncbi:AbrB/MazE/SpoVT family DNA-binding domain-containing protein [Virgibacillus halophilus]|uniref:AbrB/MazE/SpoVT family DNA-binding domain-containing protein n=1 Tax=Tigheibacillus halophilus TaxID=361280 RepID=A0ABU5C845_9BACI|nr:AbrB/MazE/SpoVT family DNA-binding domain-containing protein [Virgibacillus halophilus]
MKSTGIVRKVDALGRVVIPIELRKSLQINVKDSLEIYTDSDKIILKKHQPSMACQLTGEVSEDNLSLAEGKLILSPTSAKQLIDELQNRLNTEKIAE